MTDLLIRAFESMLGTLTEMSPYLLFGFLMAGILSVLISQETVERHLGGRGFLQVFKASLFGVPLPLCSCGVIPVAASLRKHGAGKGATTSFLISTPQTGIDSIFVTLSLLGPVYAIYRPIIAFLSGLLGGGAVSILDDNESAGSGHHEACGDDCCAAEGKAGKMKSILRYGFYTLPRDINTALIAGILIAALIGAVVPDDFFASVLGTGIVAMLVMMALGIPIYVCATASVPIAAVLIAKGISPGAALVFLMTGPATNAATILTVGRVMGGKTAAIYLGSVAVLALAAGLLLDLIYSSPAVAAPSAMPWMLPMWFKYASAVVLTTVIAASFFKIGRGKEAAPRGGQKLIFDVKGMNCQHCADSVSRSVRETGGVSGVDVDLRKERVEVTGDGLDSGLITEAIEGLGYKVKDVL